MKVKHIVLVLTCVFPLFAQADSTVPMVVTAAKGAGQLVGTVLISQSILGLEFQPHLKHLIPGYHSFHIHQNPICADNGNAVGAVFDPPTSLANEQLGGLPMLYVNADGTATTPVLAPRYKKITEISGRSLVINEGGDDFASMEHKMGSSITQTVCGVIN